MSKVVSEKEQIAKLTKELKATKEMFRQLTEEDKQESYDRRRTMMLKAQIMQLERQCMLLNDALSSRASTMLEIENKLISIIEDFQENLAQEKPGPLVNFSRKQLVNHIHVLQTLKGSIQKQINLYSVENVRIPQLFGLNFCKNKDISCLDVCTGKIDHINLQHVAYLESKLTSLLKSLISFQTLLQATTVPAQTLLTKKSYHIKEESEAPESFLLSSAFKKLSNNSEICIKQLEECCQDLLMLSLLHPTTPWSVTKTPAKFGLFDPASIIRSFPGPLQRQKDLKSVIYSMCKAHSYLMHLHQLKLNAVKEEVHLCSKITMTYIQYTNGLLKGVTQAYLECENSLSGRIREPLENILDSWIALKSNQTEENMRLFMTSFKKNEEAISQLIEQTLPNSKNSGDANCASGLKVLESYGLQLREKIEFLKRDCRREAILIEKEIENYVQSSEEDVITGLRRALFS